jgi:hypothetical protein
MSAHTPGPWIQHPATCWLIGANGHPVARVGACRVSDARLIAAAPQLLGALKALTELYALPGENNLERFERVAEMFLRETGCMAPGKDVSAASGDAMTHEERRERWEAWYAERAAKARAALALVTP